MRNINLYLNLSEEEIKKAWEDHGFTFEEAEKLMELGFEPGECCLALFLKWKGYTPQRIQNYLQFGFGDLNDLKDEIFNIEEIKIKGREITCLKWELNQKENQLIQERSKINLLNKEIQELQKELANQQRHSQHRIKELNKQLTDREKELKEICQENEELKKTSSDTLKESSLADNNSEVFELIWRKCEELELENKTLKEKLTEIKQKELKQSINTLKSKLGEDSQEDLDDLLEAQIEFTKTNNAYAQRQLEKSKKRLLRQEKLTNQEIDEVCELQNELAKLAIETENKLEAKVEVSPK